MQSRSWALKAIGDERRLAENKISQTVARSKSILVEGVLDFLFLKRFLPSEITISAVGPDEGKKEVLLRSKNYTLGIVDMDNDFRGQELEHKMNVIDTNPLCCFFAAHVRDYHRIFKDQEFFDKSQVESIVELAKYLTNIRLFWSERRPNIPSPIKLVQEIDKKRERIKEIKEIKKEKNMLPKNIFSYLLNLYIYAEMPDLKIKMSSLMEEFDKWEKQNSYWLLNVGINDHDIEFLSPKPSLITKEYVVGIAKYTEKLYSRIHKYI